MANAIIDTLKAKNTSGEEVIIYPRTTFDAVRDDEGKTLDVVISKLNNDSGGGFNEVYGETFISMGRKEGTTVGDKSIAFGDNVTATGSMSVAFGYDTKATGAYSMATGYSTEATGWESHAEGYYTKASGDYSHAEGLNNTAEGYASHAEGKQNTVSGDYAHAEGYSNTASNTSAHAEGNNTTASGAQSHAEGFYTVASAWLAHAEGDHSEASGSTSHAEGNYTKASGDYSHAEGSYSEAKGYYSHVEGSYTIASGESQHVQGKYNVEDTENKYAHIVGGGESTSKRKNIHTLDWEGNAVFAGDVTDGNGDSIASVKALIESSGGSDITVPTKVSELENDAGYITIDDVPEGATDEQVQASVESYLSENPIGKGADYSPTVKSVNHRGYSAGAPENTLPAYILSKQKGFDYAECDVAFTSDGVAVLLHDNTIDRTSDGSGSISSLTYEQLLTYDFGSWFSSEYAGTKIPTFEEFIKLCKHIDLHPYIELKSSGNYTQEQITSIVDMVKAMGMKGRVTYISFNADFLGYVKTADSSARLGYLSSTVDDSVLTTVISLRTGTNEVYASVKYTSLTDTFISDCIAANIPLEIWTVNDAEYIRNMNGYISGVTSDSLIAGDILRGEYIDSVGCIGFPTNEDGTVNYGIAGQFTITNGNGTISFVSLDIAEGGAF